MKHSSTNLPSSPYALGFIVVAATVLGSCRSRPADSSLHSAPSAAGDVTGVQEPTEEGPPVLFIADPQLHNVVGGSLKSLGFFADATGVAIRPPTLNLLAPLALDKLVRTGASPGSPILVLGDIANIACSSELEAFSDIMKRASPSGSFWLATHGNHDSFAMGVLPKVVRKNGTHLLPKETCEDKIPCTSGPSADCCDYKDFSGWTGASGWKALQNDVKDSWNSACAAPGGTSVPSNKLVWLGWYLERLTSQGATVSFDPPTDAGSEWVTAFKASAHGATPLGKAHYAAHGEWIVPKNNRVTPTARSYITQSFSPAPGVTVVLVDTANAELKMFQPSTKGGMTASHIDDAISFIQTASASGQSVAVAGHHEFKKIPPRLKQAIAAHSAEYYSAHTHSPLNIRTHRTGATTTTEINIGSTTDWPMEVMRRDFSRPIESESAFQVLSLGTKAQILPKRKVGSARARLNVLACEGTLGQEYQRPVWHGALRRKQACVHERAAVELQGFLNGVSPLTWTDSPSAACLSSASEAAVAVQSVLKRVSDPANLTQRQAEVLLCKAAAASRREGIQD